jgi:hypothetical protein
MEHPEKLWLAQLPAEFRIASPLPDGSGAGGEIDALLGPAVQ